MTLSLAFGFAWGRNQLFRVPSRVELTAQLGWWQKKRSALFLKEDFGVEAAGNFLRSAETLTWWSFPWKAISMATASNNANLSVDRGVSAGTDRNEVFKRPCGDREHLSQCTTQSTITLNWCTPRKISCNMAYTEPPSRKWDHKGPPTESKSLTGVSHLHHLKEGVASEILITVVSPVDFLTRAGQPQAGWVRSWDPRMEKCSQMKSSDHAPCQLSSSTWESIRQTQNLPPLP